MTRVLVALDGSAFAEQALEPACRLAERAGGELHLAAVVEDVPSPFLAVDAVELSGRWLDTEHQRAKEYLSGVRRSVSGDGEPPDVHTHVREGSPTRELVSLASELDADLLVLTSHGRGGFRRLWLGSTTERLLKTAELPLLVLPPGAEGESGPFHDETFPGHILVPLDGSSEAERVLPTLSLVRPTDGCRVTLVSVLQRPAPFPSVRYPDTLDDKATLAEARRRLRSHLDEKASSLTSAGPFEVEVRVIDDSDVAHAILGVCAEESVDLIALSTHGRGAVGRSLLGSVADKLVRSAELPILALRRHG